MVAPANKNCEQDCEGQMRNSALVLAALSMATMGPGGLQDIAGYSMSRGEPRKPQMELTDEEIEMLASMTGKAKKKYVKELKAKYLGVGANVKGY